MKPSRRILEPHERISEVLFGLIMVLTFTGSLSIAEAGRDDIRAMLIGALGCNIAWGIIDGVLYLMGCLADRGAELRMLLGVRVSSEAEHAHGFIARALPAPIAAVIKPEELEPIRQRLAELPEAEIPDRARLSGRDWLGALGVFLIVFLSTFPVAIPFIVMSHAQRAMRVSNAIAVVMLFIAGWMFGRITGVRGWLVGVGMVVLGLILVGLTIVLGG